MHESYPKGGPTGSRKVFSGETLGGDGMTNRDGREKRDYMKSGRSAVCTQAQSSEKFKPGSESAGRGADFSKTSYPKHGHSATKFGSTVSQGS